MWAKDRSAPGWTPHGTMMTDFQNDMYRRYLASGQAEKAEAFRQAGADQRGAELAQTEADVREAVERHVYCDMCLSDIQSTCR